MGFDALGERVHPEVLREGDDGPHDLRTAAAAVQTLDEPTVDLEGVHRETLQVGEGRVAGAEVVEIDLDAEVVQPMHDVDGELGNLDDGALGDLELQPIGRELNLGEDLLDVDHELLATELVAEEIDADGRRSHPVESILPLERLFAAGPQDPLADGVDETGFFGQGEKLAGWKQTTLGVLPAQESLACDDATRRGVDDRLVVEPELVPFEGASEIVHQMELAQHEGVHRLVVDEVAVPAVALRPVHGDVGIAEDFVGGLVSVRADGDSGAGGGVDLLIADLEGP